MALHLIWSPHANRTFRPSLLTSAETTPSLPNALPLGLSNKSRCWVNFLKWDASFRNETIPLFEKLSTGIVIVLFIVGSQPKIASRSSASGMLFVAPPILKT